MCNGHYNVKLRKSASLKSVFSAVMKNNGAYDSKVHRSCFHRQPGECVILDRNRSSDYTRHTVVVNTEKKLNICSIQELGALADIFNGEVTKMPIEDNLKSILSRYMLYSTPPRICSLHVIYALISVFHTYLVPPRTESWHVFLSFLFRQSHTASISTYINIAKIPQNNASLLYRQLAGYSAYLMDGRKNLAGRNIGHPLRLSVYASSA